MTAISGRMVVGFSVCWAQSNRFEIQLLSILVFYQPLTSC